MTKQIDDEEQLGIFITAIAENITGELLSKLHVYTEKAMDTCCNGKTAESIIKEELIGDLAYLISHDYPKFPIALNIRFFKTVLDFYVKHIQFEANDFCKFLKELINNQPDIEITRINEDLGALDDAICTLKNQVAKMAQTLSEQKESVAQLQSISAQQDLQIKNIGLLIK